MTTSGGFFLFRIFATFFRWISSRYNTTSQLQGTWDYECVVIGENVKFPHVYPPSNAHGGKCTIKIKNRFYTTSVSVRGVREWNGNVSANGDLERHDSSEPINWRSEVGAFIGHDEVMYTYSIRDEPVYGITFLTLFFGKNDGMLKPHGKFYYFPKNEKRVPNFKSVTDRQIQEEFGGISGIITFKEHRKEIATIRPVKR